MIRYSVDDFVGPLTPEQRDELDKVLMPGERILWATQPRASFWHNGNWQAHGVVLSMFLACVLLFGLFGGVAVLLHYLLLVIDGEGGWRGASLCLFPLLVGGCAAWLCGRRLLAMVCDYACIRRHRRHTLYVLTDKRAMSLEPRFEGWVTRCYALEPDMVLERRQSRAGGELIFRIENPSLPGHEVRRGWTTLENAEEAEEKIRAAVAARLLLREPRNKA